MQYAQAITILRKMQAAAPPTAAARIGAVIDLMIDLFDQNAALRTHAEPVPQASIDPLFQQTVDLLLPALTSLRGQIRALRSGNLGRFNSEQESALHLAEQQADSAFDMIDSLFTLMKVESGVIEIHSEAFDGEATINRAWNWVKDRAEARGHRVAMRIDDPLPTVLGDPIQVLTILVDLMENAVLYTPPGGTIRMTADTLGTHVLFGIEDTGIGLSPDDRVGEPFWRGVEHPLVRQHPGGGLRLYLASELLRMMGGELFFSGEPGEGSTFSFTLPTAK